MENSALKTNSKTKKDNNKMKHYCPQKTHCKNKQTAAQINYSFTLSNKSLCKYVQYSPNINNTNFDVIYEIPINRLKVLISIYHLLHNINIRTQCSGFG